MPRHNYFPLIVLLCMLFAACSSGAQYPNRNKWVVHGDIVPLRGAVKKVTTILIDSAAPEMYALFDKNGNLLETNTTYNATGSYHATPAITHHSYYDNGMMKQMVRYYPELNEILQADTFVKEGKNQCRRYTTSRSLQNRWGGGEPGDSLSYSTIFRYNEKHYIEREDHYQTVFRQGKKTAEELLSSYRSEYNEKGQLLKVSTRRDEQDDYRPVNQFYYSAWPTPDSVTMAEGAYQTTHYYFYDKQGNMTGEKEKSPMGIIDPLRNVTYTHRFDKQGNWIYRETRNAFGDMLKKENRTIIYWNE